jgi:hypothetical protein
MIGIVPKRDRVQVVTCNGSVVEISSAGREEIVAQLRHHEASRPEVSFHLVLSAFENAGESGRVSLDEWQEANLIDTIGVLAKKVGGESKLDSGVAELRRTLVKEERARWAEEEAGSRSNAAARILVLAGLLWVARSISSRSRKV